VRAALDAARYGSYAGRLCVSSLHRYSRTRSLWQSFADASSTRICSLSRRLCVE